MPLESFALAIYLTASEGRTTAVAVLVALFALQFGILLILRHIFRAGGSDGDDPGSDGGGPGRRRSPAPRRPPPDDPVCWPEFERQFAEYVAERRQAPITRIGRCRAGRSPRA
jgi:hypothetical protein